MIDREDAYVKSRVHYFRHHSDSKKKSMVETLTDIALGFLIYLPVNIFVLPYFTSGIEEYSLATALTISAIYTSIALGRKYTLRRLFERMRN